MFYLLRIMSKEITGVPLRNYVIFSRDLPSAKDFATRLFGRLAVLAVEPVDTLSLLPKDTEYLE